MSFRIVKLDLKSNDFDILETNKQSSRLSRIKSKYDCSLKSWFANFIDDEVYPDYSWDECGKVTNCIMKTKIWLWPKYLVIQLMRFQSDKSYVRSVMLKNEQFVDFRTENLNLQNLWSNDQFSTDCIYDLYGVIHHSGTIGFGHYYATIRDNIDSEDWYLYNGKFWFLIEYIKINFKFYLLCYK